MRRTTLATKSLVVSSLSLALFFVAGSCSAPQVGSRAENTPARAPVAGLPLGVYEVVPGVYSGPMPEGRAGFEALAALGVVSVLSVDGARPDVGDAAACEIAYAHVPIRYSGLTEGERDEIARAMRDAPRPLYVHCHHGKHRGPAAAAVGLIALGEIDNDAGLALLERAGTSRSYPGLWGAVREGETLDTATIEAAPAAPPVAQVSDFVSGMSVVDHAWDNLKRCKAAGWAAPTDHPDLAPASEAGILADALRAAAHDPAVADKPSDFHAWMREANASATELERLIVAGAPRGRVGEGFATLGASCKACHAKYRD